MTTYQKLDRDPEALAHCDLVLALDPKNVKTLFRKGKILAKMNEHEDAIAVFAAALAIEPENQQFKEELQRTKQAMASYSKKLRSVYGSMLKGMGREGGEPEVSTPQKIPAPADLDNSRAEIDVVGESPAKPPPATLPNFDLEPEQPQSSQSAKRSPAGVDELKKMIMEEAKAKPAGQHRPDPTPAGSSRKAWWLSGPGLSALSVLVAVGALYLTRAFA